MCQSSVDFDYGTGIPNFSVFRGQLVLSNPLLQNAFLEFLLFIS